MQDYLATFDKVKHLLPGLGTLKMPMSVCHADIPEVTSAAPWAKAHPVHRSGRPFYFDAPEFRQIDQLLDVGGGPGHVASLLKEEHPRIKITIFDFPAVCEHALDIFRESGQSDDLGAHAGDFFVDPFPTGFKAIQFSHVLELFPSERVVGLLQKAFDALPRGGRLLVYGIAGEEAPHLPGAHPAGPVAPRCGTIAYSAEQYRRWLRSVGFTQVKCRCSASGNVFLAAIK